MKQKPDEMPDEWVRQSLGQLPDAPPPGSTFDAERLWAQLRPELDTVPVRRPYGWAWWAAAACLSGLIFGWFLLHQPADDHRADVAHTTVEKANSPILTERTPPATNNITALKPARSVQARRIVKLRKEGNNSETPKHIVVMPTPEPAETVARLPELPTATDIALVREKLAQPEKINAAAVAQKRRFRVVHQNELRAEEEARPKLYRAEHFVRIGIRQPDSPAPDERQPAPIISLTSKPNH